MRCIQKDLKSEIIWIDSNSLQRLATVLLIDKLSLEEKKRGREERGKAVQRGVGKEERQERRRGKEGKFVRKQDDRDRMVTQREGQERKRPRKAEESRVQ